MAQIGFTEKQEHVYDRFNALRLAYQAKHGRTYAPGFLTKLMDAWENQLGFKLATPEDLEAHNKRFIHQYPGGDFDMQKAQEYIFGKPENNQHPVIIKESGGGMYLQSSSVATENFGMTHDRSEAMVFDSSDQAKAFLRQAGREVGDWILEPVNQ